MKNIVPLNIPKSPSSKDIDSIHRYLNDLHLFLVSHFQNGTGTPSFTQEQLDNIKEPENALKIFGNATTGRLNCSILVDGKPVIKEIATVP